MLCGIDVGLSGAIAFYDPKTKTILDLFKMPLRECGGVMLGGSSKREIDFEAVAKIIRAMPPTLTIIEKVASSPQMGVTSAFRFGESLGGIRGVMAGLGIQPRYVYPAVWKAGFGLSANKRDSVTLACQLWPAWSQAFKNGPSSADLAEAALLAYYGEKLLAPLIGPFKD